MTDHHPVSLPFGAELTATGTTRFRLWAPSAQDVQLVIDGRPPEPMRAEGAGWRAAELRVGAGTRYSYQLPDGLMMPDPASRQQADDVNGPSVVVDPNSYAWRNTGWRGRPWHEAVVYELHVGAYGGFDGVRARLPELKALGVTAVELMPISDFPGERNWGYDGVLPYAPDAAYGTPDQLKALVDEAHGLGLMVFLDVVYNHFGPDGNYLHAYAEPFFRDDIKTPWGASIDFRKPEVRQYFIGNATMWVEEYRFDGLRFDAVHAISETDFLDELAAAIRQAAGPDRHVHLILENEVNSAERLRNGYDAQWTDDWHHCLHVLLTGESEGYYQDFKDAARLLARCCREGFAYQGEVSPHSGKPRGEPSGDLPTTSFVICLQNHDQIGNRAMGERLTKLADRQGLRAAAALLLLSPFIPMLFMGEEGAAETPFLFFTSHNDELAELVRNGRREEFKHFSAFQDEKKRAQIPDPNAPSTFQASIPDSSASDPDMFGVAPAADRTAHAADRAGNSGLPQHGRRGGERRGGDRALAPGHRRAAHARDQPGHLPRSDAGFGGRHAARIRGRRRRRVARRCAAGALHRGADRAGSVSDAELAGLADAAGLSTSWRDAFGKDREVAPPTLRAVLKALGLPADTDAEARDSRQAVREAEHGTLPPLVTAVAGGSTVLPVAAGRFDVQMEDGHRFDGRAEDENGRARLPGIERPGYHRVRIGDRETVLAVAPERCFGIADAAPGRKLWGLAAQLYALRRSGDGGIGDFTALAEFARSAARHGAAAVAISPVHAQFSADPDRFSPYAPSSRVLANVLHADPGGGPPDAEERRLESLDLLDWPAATRARLARLRRVFEDAERDPARMSALDEFRRARGDVLESHARFEALHAHFFGQDKTRWNWRGWDAPYRDPRSPEVARFAQENAREVTFHAFVQWLAETGLQTAQDAARGAGMPIGLVADLAVGTDGGGSHCWSRQDETLLGLSVGAPPDLLSLEGQNWGLTAFSPRGLRQHGFAAFIEMLQAALRHAGGVRIDHSMGLARLWMVPDGGSSADGAYLRFPFEDMIRLVTLESSRHRAIVMAEDLGTVPEGFGERLQSAGILGMRVLWFERDKAENFTPPRSWTRGAAAMTSTHDLATVAGWWAARDLDWRQRLHLLGDEANVAKEHRARWRDRHALWEAMRESGSVSGATPMPHDTWPAVQGAMRHVGGSACELVMLPVEDALAQEEQPNLPGTLHEHPNWQRRMPAEAAHVLDDPNVEARLRALDEARRTA